MNDREWAKRGCDLAASLAVLLMFLSLAGGCVYFVGNSAATVREENRRRRQEAIVSESEFARTVTHDGHWWVVWNYKEDVSHHPECPCANGRAEKEKE